MTRLIFFALLLCSRLSLYAQDKYDQVWVFDKYIIMNFSTSPPTITVENPTPWLGPGNYTTSICDKYGGLIFYSGGCFVGNRLHQVMKNGDKINSALTYTGWCNYGDFPINNSNTIIPYPDAESKYILFNMDMDKTPPGSDTYRPWHLLYHVVDMTRENGLGEVVEKNKIAVDTFLALGSLSACRNSNGRDWWVVAPVFNSNCYYAVPVTPDGVGTPILRCAGLSFSKDDSGGQATFSPDGTKFARIEADNGLVLMDFDASTGAFSNPVILQYTDDYLFDCGASFSGNSRYLYVTATDRIWQYDTEAADIQSTVQWVGGMNFDTVTLSQGGFSHMQMGPDGKIYIACVGQHRWISNIERPNCPGLLSQSRVHKTYLIGNNYWGINNLPHFRVPAQTYDCDVVGTEEVVEAGMGITLSPNPATDHVMLRSSASGRLVIFSTDGRQLADAPFAEGTTRVPFHLAPGLYFFRLMTGNTYVRTEKVAVH